MKVAALTLGCKVNQYDTGEILRAFARKGCEIVPPGPDADIILVNTCDVTNTSGKKSRQMIRRAAGLSESAVVAALGCYARTAREEVLRAGGANLAVAAMDYDEIVSALEKYLKETGRGALSEEPGGEPGADAAPETGPGIGKTRYFLKIEDGCDMFCSYCVIPYARGRVRSRPPGEILAEARRAVTNGYREIVLTGIHIASYGKDLINENSRGEKTNLPGIIREVCGVEGLWRLRLGSVEPGAADGDFLEAAASPKVCGHFHLSLQSGCDAVLRAMNRKYTAEGYARAAARLREARPDAYLTTDVIAGFPGETDEDFEETCRFVERIGFLKIHAFPFSPKNGTAAASLPGRVPGDVKAARVKRLTGISDKMSEGIYRAHVGQIVDVLIEEESGGYLRGHTHSYLRVSAKGAAGPGMINRTLPVRVTEAEPGCAYGEIV